MPPIAATAFFGFAVGTAPAALEEDCTVPLPLESLPLLPPTSAVALAVLLALPLPEALDAGAAPEEVLERLAIAPPGSEAVVAAAAAADSVTAVNITLWPFCMITSDVTVTLTPPTRPSGPPAESVLKPSTTTMPEYALAV